MKITFSFRSCLHQRWLQRGALALLVAAAGSFIAGPSPAAWPPKENFTAADMAKSENWPNDPGYGYSDKSKGQWNYYSFVPEQSGNLTLRPEETASGMSIDLAWRFSQGDDRIRIAVMDSGINWDKADLIERAWLNPVELANHKPTKANGDPCGGSDDLAGYDCNGDGIFTVSDYAETPTLEPPAGMGTPLGDKNGNGVLDAGDLILNFSDGIDDDNNGYIDDISGWDFMKDDNNPYDDTRYGHGTGEAIDSVATGNNGIGGIGGCPKCRFMAMRVGDSFITDVNGFAQAVVYATDNGARVVQCALGTINMNRFTQQALDYAYANGVLNVTSMADENARHHNMPATANHTLPVHAITFAPGNKVTNVETFLDFNTCTNYGGQNYLSAAGEGCSSEAVGQLSGMSGLLFSAALAFQTTPPLTAAEAMQLWMQTADDIDVAESRIGEDAKYFWSQPGFDQRFGYGRVNANTAIENLKAGKIPPEVDIVRPYWFETLYADKVNEPINIHGTLRAPRANSFDYFVEWAPGVEPLDDEFTVVASETNVPSTTVIGGPVGCSDRDCEAIASLEIRSLDTSHEADEDSPNGENERTITVRIRSVAHYGGDIGDVNGELRRTYAIHRDPSLVKGFPIYLGDSGEASAKLADMDGDGVRDLVFPTTAGEIHVLKLTASGPKPIAGFPFKGDRVPGLSQDATNNAANYLKAPAYANKAVDPALAGDSFGVAPAIADIDGDGKNEIVITSWNGFIYIVEDDGSRRPGWPKKLPSVPSCPRDGSPANGPCSDTENIIDTGAFASPVLADMDKDGDLDIIQAAFDGKVYVMDIDGNDLPGWPVTVHYKGPLSDEPRRGRIMTTPAVADFNDDGIPEILVGSNERLGAGEQSGAGYLIDGRGTAVSEQPWLSNWPITMTSFYLFPLVAEGVTNAGVIAEYDGKPAAIMHGNASMPTIVPADPGKQTQINETPPNSMPVYEDPSTGETRQGVAPSSQFGALSKAFRPNTMLPLFSQPSLGDIDQDGVTDIVASGSSLNLAINLQKGAGKLPGEHLVSVWSGKTGDMLPGAPFVIEDYSFFNSHAIADMNGDDYPEVITGSGGYFLHAFDACGREPEGWPKFTGQWIISTPAVGDLDGDGSLEVVVATRSGWLYAWHTEGKTDGIIEWESFHHDNRNTGNIAVPLDQGDSKRKAKEPMTVAMCESLLAVPEDTSGNLRAGGGCGACAVGNTQSSQPNKSLFGLAFLALAFASLRRRLRRG